MLRLPQAFALIALIGLAACAPKPTAPPPPGAVVTVINSDLVSIDVTIAESVRYNVLPRFDGETDEAVSARVTEVLARHVEADARSVFTGPRPVRLTIDLTMIDVASGAGRALMQSDSFLQGEVRIVDAETGEVINGTKILAADEAMHAGGNIGGLFSLVSNIADAGEDRFEVLSTDFALKTGQWLRR